ncbi:hypothetical protein KOR34_41440 [Posidoniimonas corsicana]|uniref:PilZ domain-containing protein n=1 Tax=Posidoniimonas corsicana TaxID=1938618 RepID=A0A5C5V1T8_9BACT|nr:PilZ domain-containing protein [Posidoniimonas corsicana]TWT32381.1 hypothetical protein KOR34_41440 [Posidoniimonas corsicana]
MNQCKVVLGPDIVAPLGVASGVGQPEPTTVMIGKCCGCRRRLDWPSPQPGAWASPVDCPQCGRWYYTEARNAAAPRLRRDCLPTPDAFTQQQSERVVSSVESALQQTDRRSEPRTTTDRTLTVVPLDATLASPRLAVEARLLNVSPSGCCVELSKPHEAAYLLIDCGSVGFPGIQVLGEVRWTQADGAAHRLGCEFRFGESGELPLE